MAKLTTKSAIVLKLMSLLNKWQQISKYPNEIEDIRNATVNLYERDKDWRKSFPHK